MRGEPAVDAGRRRRGARRGDGAEVHARRGEDLDALRGARRARSSTRAPQITLDDGADLIARCTRRGPTLDGLLGATEETTTGLVRLRAMEAEGRLACPVLAVNEARTERAFNDRYGTGQSALDGILRATNLLLAGRTRRRARLRLDRAAASRCARAAPARSVIVCEVDPIARARGADGGLRGHAGARGRRARRRLRHRHRRRAACCAREHFERMKDGAVLANAGHFDVEIDLDGAARAAAEPCARCCRSSSSTTSAAGA